MSISSVSLATSAYQLDQTNAPQNSIGQQFMQLQQALQSGDLSAAQSAYSAIQNSIQSSSNGQGPLSGTSQLSSDFQAIGSALQSGDVSSAQSAFATFQQDMQSMQQASSSGSGGVHHHHHHHGGQVNSAMAQQMNDLNSIGSALQSGNASSAQSALSAFLQDIQNNSS